VNRESLAWSWRGATALPRPWTPRRASSNTNSGSVYASASADATDGAWGGRRRKPPGEELAGGSRLERSSPEEARARVEGSSPEEARATLAGNAGTSGRRSVAEGGGDAPGGAGRREEELPRARRDPPPGAVAAPRAVRCQRRRRRMPPTPRSMQPAREKGT